MNGRWITLALAAVLVAAGAPGAAAFFTQTTGPVLADYVGPALVLSGVGLVARLRYTASLRKDRTR